MARNCSSAARWPAGADPSTSVSRVPSPASMSFIAALAGVRVEAMSRKSRFVWSFSTAPDTAMPTAPPRLRIMLNRPLAYFGRSGGRLPRPSVTAGATAKTCGNPRRLCGNRNSSPPQSMHDVGNRLGTVEGGPEAAAVDADQQLPGPDVLVVGHQE